MSQQDLTGQRVERYQVERKLGQGGMAIVYLATDTALARQVVLKVMRPHLAHDENFVGRFQREARAMARLDHPNVIKVFNTGFTPDHAPYFSMQYVSGGTLTDKLRELNQMRQRMPDLITLQLIQQLAHGLSAAHNAGIVHRDIKPSNILLQPNGLPILTDLGIAAVQEGAKLTQTGVAIGTPHYMSPEQAAGKPVDGRSDLYSLGIVLYELLAGSVPFNAESSMAILHSHIYEQHPPLKNFHPNLKPKTYQIVDTCLAKQPHERFQTANELAAALDDAIQAEQGSLGSEKRIEKRPVWLYPLIGLVLILLIGFFGFLAFSGRDGGGNDVAVSEEGGNVAERVVVVVETAVVTSTAEPDTPTPEPVVEPQATSTRVPEPTNTSQPTATPPPTPTPTATPLICEGALPTRLTLNQSARVSTFQINVRAAPGTSFGIVGRLAVDREVTITGGPECDEGQLWYYVVSERFINSSGEETVTEGWVVEESGNQYFLEPLE